MEYQEKEDTLMRIGMTRNFVLYCETAWLGIALVLGTGTAMAPRLLPQPVPQSKHPILLPLLRLNRPKSVHFLLPIQGTLTHPHPRSIR